MENKIVGTLSAIQYNKDDVNEHSQKFWSKLLDQMKNNIESFYHVWGIVVLPEYRNMGIGENLYSNFIKDHEPDLVCGESNNPRAVSIRENIFSKFKYQTYYGKSSVANSKTPSYLDNLIHAYLNSENNLEKLIDIDNAIFKFNGDILQPKMYDLDQFENRIRSAFQKQQKIQKVLGNTGTAVSTLISVSKLLDEVLSQNID